MPYKFSFTATGILLLLLLFFLPGCNTSPKHADDASCTRIRAAFDVGSANTKLTVAEVDTCRNEITDILMEEERAVAFNEALVRTGPDEKPSLPDAIITKGQKVLDELKNRAHSHNPDSYSGIATSVFRNASNGQQAVEQLSQSTGIPLRLISQNTEARLGLIGASRYADDPEDTVAVWDIGAGSMQLTVRRPDQPLRIYRGDLGSVPFKRTVIRLTGKDPDRVKSPNPLGIFHGIRAYAFALSRADRNVPGSIQTILKQQGQPVVGIGGVHVYSIRPQVVKGSTKIYTHKDVVRTLVERSLMNDEDIGGEYASTEVTNLALVGGMMDALQINRVRVANVNLTDGLLLADDLWNETKRINQTD